MRSHETKLDHFFCFVLMLKERPNFNPIEGKLGSSLLFFVKNPWGKRYKQSLSLRLTNAAETRFKNLLDFWLGEKKTVEIKDF